MSGMWLFDDGNLSNPVSSPCFCRSLSLDFHPPRLSSRYALVRPNLWTRDLETSLIPVLIDIGLGLGRQSKEGSEISCQEQGQDYRSKEQGQGARDICQGARSKVLKFSALSFPEHLRWEIPIVLGGTTSPEMRSTGDVMWNFRHVKSHLRIAEWCHQLRLRWEWLEHLTLSALPSCSSALILSPTTMFA